MNGRESSDRYENLTPQQPKHQGETQDRLNPKDRVRILRDVLQNAEKDFAVHDKSNMLWGVIESIRFCLVQNETGFHIAAMCEETSVQIDITLDGAILKSEETPQQLPSPKNRKEEDRLLNELQNGVNRYARPYANHDGMILAIAHTQAEKQNQT